MEYRIREMADFPGIRRWGALNKRQFSDEFIEYVENKSDITRE